MRPEWNPRELELLAGTFLFQGLEWEPVRRAVQDPLCTRENYQRGDVIYSPGHFRRSLGVLLEGRARVTKGELVVSTLERGDLFGAAALYNRRTRYETTITALEDCAVAFFPQELVSRLMAESPAACANYIRYLSERIHFLNRKIEGLTGPGAVGKLARRVTKAEYRAAERYMADCGIADGFTQERTSAKEEYTPDFHLQGI